MPTLTPSQAILIGLFVSPILFALCAYFTRANLHRIASGLVGVIAFGLVQYAWDRVAASAGWWSYPAYETAGSLPMPLALYLFAGLVYAGMGLIGWRIGRRYGWKGILVFLLVWGLWGFIHDTAGSSLFANSRLMVIGPGIVPRIADFLVYVTCMGSVLWVIHLLGGSLPMDTFPGVPTRE